MPTMNAWRMIASLGWGATFISDTNITLGGTTIIAEVRIGTRPNTSPTIASNGIDSQRTTSPAPEQRTSCQQSAHPSCRVPMSAPGGAELL
jgi:hypothetical protein